MAHTVHDLHYAADDRVTRQHGSRVELVQHLVDGALYRRVQRHEGDVGSGAGQEGDVGGREADDTDLSANEISSNDHSKASSPRKHPHVVPCILSRRVPASQQCISNLSGHQFGGCKAHVGTTGEDPLALTALAAAAGFVSRYCFQDPTARLDAGRGGDDSVGFDDCGQDGVLGGVDIAGEYGEVDVRVLGEVGQRAWPVVPLVVSCVEVS